MFRSTRKDLGVGLVPTLVYFSSLVAEQSADGAFPVANRRTTEASYKTQ